MVSVSRPDKGDDVAGKSAVRSTDLSEVEKERAGTVFGI